MTRARRRQSVLQVAGAAMLVAGLGARPAWSITVDDRGEMRFGMRAYTNVRIATEQRGGDDDPLSFPNSPPGHVQQHRYFLELKFDHNIRRLATEGRGLAAVFGWLQPDELDYSLQYRGEWEGVYDYGPSEYRDPVATALRYQADLPDAPALNLSPDIPEALARRRARLIQRISRHRHRFFLGYIDIAKGPVFVRAGRQILAWGETDIFRLLDNINPLDSSFGGFLIALDERRVPLDMLRASYRFGSFGPIHDAYLEGFVARGDRIAVFPPTPPGAVWIPGGVGAPNPALRTVVDIPDKWDVRGGGRFVFTAADVTASLAHYYTYLDTPGVRFIVPGPTRRFPLPTPSFGHEIVAVQEIPRVAVTGASMTFPLERFYAIVRSEAAWFKGEPFNRQGRGDSADTNDAPGTPAFRRLARQRNTEGGLNPFVYPGFLNLARTGPIHGRTLQRDSFNMSIGLDVNQYIRWLNRQQTFLFTTQFFYKHVFDSPGDLVLPVPHHNNKVDPSLLAIGTACTTPRGGTRACRLEPRLFDLNDDQFLHTFAVFTSYRGGRVLPTVAVFYDWQGAVLVQPGVSLVRDPFRLIMDYTRIAGPPTGQIGTLRDRDNVRFQLEFVF